MLLTAVREAFRARRGALRSGVLTIESSGAQLVNSHSEGFQSVRPYHEMPEIALL